MVVVSSEPQSDLFQAGVRVGRCFGGKYLLTEGGGHADDETFARGELFGQIDLIAGGTFDEVDVWKRITDFDHVDGCLMESANGFVEYWL